MAMALTGTRKIVKDGAELASRITRRWVGSSTQQHRMVNRPDNNVRRWAAESRYHHCRYSSAPQGVQQLSDQEDERLIKEFVRDYERQRKEAGEPEYHWSAGDMFDVDEKPHPLTSDKDLAVSKAFEEYHKQIVKESSMVYPLRVTSQSFAALKVFQVLLVGGGGEVYESVCVAPNLEDLDDQSMKVASFRKVQGYGSPFNGLIGEINEVASPEDDPRIIDVARFALSHNHKRDKFREMIKATSQMISGCEVLRMMFCGELNPLLRYEAIVLVHPETGNMDLVLLRLAYDPEGKYDCNILNEVFGM